MHVERAHPPANPVTQQVTTGKAPKVTPPTIDMGIDQEEWHNFLQRWKNFCRMSKIDKEMQSLQLFQCASMPLGDLLLKSNPSITECAPETVLKALEKIAVIHVAKGVVRAELMKMAQSGDEPIRNFVAKVQGKARVCGFVTSSTCHNCQTTQDVDYTEEVIKDVVIAGLSDGEIRNSVLDIDEVEKRSLNDIVSIIERKEKNRKAYCSPAVAAISTFKKQQNKSGDIRSKRQQPPGPSKKIPCPRCGYTFRKFNGKNIKPFQFCLKCFRSSSMVSIVKRTDDVQVETSGAADSEIDAGVALLQEAKSLSSSINTVQRQTTNSSHAKVQVREHPKVTIQVCPIGKNSFATVTGIADTGAQSNIWGFKDFKAAGFETSDLQDASINICAANKEPIPIEGGLAANLQGITPDGQAVKCESMIYVSKVVSGLFLSFDTLVRLKAVTSEFPIIGSCQFDNKPKLFVQSMNSSAIGSADCVSQTCDCPCRTAVPPRPKSLPFSPTPENVDKMKNWLMENFKSSTFNVCPHRPLQAMSGPPIKIHIDKCAEPRVCNTPAPVPLHWQQQVEEDLRRDEALGILEKVPYGVPVTWCHRMVVTRKHDGSPRRTVDLSPLNKFCRRETHSAESPFHLARRIPGQTWKTVCDAWNGYHSVPLRKQTGI